MRAIYCLVWTSLRQAILFIRTLVPTWEQFSKWSLPAKASYVGTVLAVALLVWGIVWAAISSFWSSRTPITVELVDAVGSEIRLSVTNPTSQQLVIHNAYLVALFPPIEKDHFAQLRVTALAQDGRSFPAAVEKDSSGIIAVNKQSIASAPDMEFWARRVSEYDQEIFLRRLARYMDAGSIATCAIYLIIADQSPITENDFSYYDSRLQSIDCRVLVAITGDFAPYEFGHEKYSKDPPLKPRTGHRGR